MSTGGLPEETLKKVQYREYWEEPHSKWGNTDTWDHYFIEKIPDATKHKSHNALGAELKVLIQNLRPETRAGRKALAMQRDLRSAQSYVHHDMHTLLCATPYAAGLWKKSVWSLHHCSVHILLFHGSRTLRPLVELRKMGNTLKIHLLTIHIEDEVSNSQTHPTVEELIFDTHIATLLLQYRRVLEEMRNHYVEQESQRGRHLSNMLKWSVVDHSLFNGFKFVVSLLRPAINMSLLEPILMESRNKPIHHVVTILRNLITKEIVDDISPGFKRWLERLWKVRIKEYYIIDTITALTAITSVIFYSPTPCRGPGSKPSENHIKSQMWAKIFSDTFLIDSDDIDVNWEYHHQIPGNGGSGSARSDIAAVVFNDTDQQFPFFIAEFETDGFSVHKVEMVVAAEAAFEYNRILTAAYYLSEDEVNSSRLHIGLINGTTIHLGSMKPIYDEEKKSLIYAYEINNVTFKLYTGNQEADIASALKLVAYLRTNVCQDGISLKALLNRKKNMRNGTLLAALPRLPKRAVKSRPKSDTEFTPQARRIIYIDVGRARVFCVLNVNIGYLQIFVYDQKSYYQDSRENIEKKREVAVKQLQAQAVVISSEEYVERSKGARSIIARDFLPQNSKKRNQEDEDDPEKKNAVKKCKDTTPASQTPENQVVADEPGNQVVADEPENQVVADEPESQVVADEPDLDYLSEQTNGELNSRTPSIYEDEDEENSLDGSSDEEDIVELADISFNSFV
ncbi:15637_t:CDS:2, partial [Dentiscutata erythropus]